MWFLPIAFLLFQGTYCSPVTSADDPLVYTKAGPIRGLKATDGDYNMFTGIPYARVNPYNPFGLNIPQPPFEEVFDATKETVVCAQLLELIREDIYLDCLQLNVFVPASATNSSALPVLIWIHGGGFTSGWGGIPLAGPGHLVKHDVIVVSINYRLDVYGFMCLDIPEVPGNQGLKDQIAGIKWVKENIPAFGGDSDKITIMGQSAGGASVDYLLRFTEPNLFDKAVMLSGSSESNYAKPQKPNYQFAITLATFLGFRTTDTYKALDFLATANPKQIMLLATMLNGGPAGPCIEKEFSSVEILVHEDPAITKMPNVKTTPILAGYTDAEMGLFISLEPSTYTDIQFQLKAKSLGFENEEAKDIGNIIKRFYVGDANKKDISKEEMMRVVYFQSDSFFIHTGEKAIAQYIENGAEKIYRYTFTYTGQRNYFQYLGGQLDGAVHGDELGYLFDLFLFNQPILEQDQLQIDRITTLFTNFVKYGDPTPETSELLPLQWPQSTPEKSYYLNIGKELTVGTRPNRERMAFWDLMDYLINLINKAKES